VTALIKKCTNVLYVISIRCEDCYQWRRHTRAFQGKCPGRNASALAVALAAALAVKVVINTIIIIIIILLSLDIIKW